MRFPVLLSIPHGGTEVPDWIRPKFCLSEAALFSDGDPFTRDIYDLDGSVFKVVAADIARTVVDMNRAPDDLPTRNPDGVVKTHTCEGLQIYQEPLTDNHVAVLLEKFHRPYHEALSRAVTMPGLKLALDCHSMLPEGPRIGPDHHCQRPLICLSNCRDTTCPRDVTAKFASCLRQAFQLPEEAVQINEPFSGGYITRTYGGKPIPWLQVEINRSLYLEDPPFGQYGPNVRRDSLRQLQSCFFQTLQQFFYQ